MIRTIVAIAFSAMVCMIGFGAEPEAITYTLERVPGPAAAVRVSIALRGEESGKSRFAMAPDWAGVDHCERFVNDLRARDGAGGGLKVEVDPAAAHVWTVSHAPGAALVVSYELRPVVPDPLADMATRYQPVVRDDLVHLIGETSLLYPEWLESKDTLAISLDWVGFDRPGWSAVSSFSGEAQPLARTMQQFRHAMFLAGNVRVVDLDVPGGKLRVAICGSEFGSGETEFAEMVRQVVLAEREFVQDFSAPYFLVTAVPTGPRVQGQNLSLGGTGLVNCFALFLPPGTSIGAGSPHRNPILHLLAHEYFHTWNGETIGMENPEQLVYWFSEGFTDFYASRLMRRAGLVDDSVWLGWLNESLKKLWMSPAATEPAATIERDFWKRQDVQRLPYNRGEAVAVMMDEEIRRASGGRQSLDDFFREVLAAARGGEKSETGRLLARLARMTSPEFAESIRRIVVDGAMPELPAKLTDPAVARTEVDAYRYDPGFEVDASIKAKIATGVRDGSAAHAAGLREGMAIRGFSVHYGDADKEIKLNVLVEGESRSISFLPRGAKVRLPQYGPAASH